MADGLQTLVLGGGCFWCTEAVYVQVRGVLDVESGYCNGNLPEPNYEMVCSGASGYCEVVKLIYDPTQVSTRELLEIFFVIHDPTTLNRQGNDVGEQYQSTIFYTSAEQKTQAEQFIAKLTSDGIFPNPIVTQIKPFDKFYVAENYQQNYYDIF